MILFVSTYIVLDLADSWVSHMMHDSHISVYVNFVLFFTEPREAPQPETQDNNVKKTSGGECKNLPFTVLCNINSESTGDTIYIRRCFLCWCYLFHFDHCVSCVLFTGHILAITFGVLFAITFLVFSMYTYQQKKKYSKYVHAHLWFITTSFKT